ncbi:PilZ domain-containing protein [Sphingomicrobium nitratireducens]|uniref:PilZ domain-containing protein n=1 Tax=Sphingomicrobium nitratireducens TaxID=2964666 RepID=UPI0022402AD2|nr:PilZ domain-containing protein [Sphingomicrobium nitratireducens]
MDESSSSQNRRARRSHVLMTASIDVAGEERDVKLRNLSPHGAMIEGEPLPGEGDKLLFIKQDIRVSGKVAWREGNRAGIAFDLLLPIDIVMRHVPQKRAKMQPKFARPGLSAQKLTPEEKRFAENYVWGDPLVRPFG